MCRVLLVPRSSYYKWKNSTADTDKYQEDRRLLAHIRRIHAESDGVYGVPRISKALHAETTPVNHKRVARLMRQAGIQGVRRQNTRPRTTTSAHTFPIAENILAREFTATEPNRKWCGDITYVRLRNGSFVYLAMVLDLFSRRILGWQVSRSLEAGLVIEAQRRALLLRRPEPGQLLMHSDRGSQYASNEFRSQLQQWKVQQSMSRKGNCHDNAVAESFFATMEVEVLRRYCFESLEQATQILGHWIEQVYNRTRLHSTLGYCSPIDFERLYCQ